MHFVSMIPSVWGFPILAVASEVSELGRMVYALFAILPKNMYRGSYGTSGDWHPHTLLEVRWGDY